MTYNYCCLFFIFLVSIFNSIHIWIVDVFICKSTTATKLQAPDLIGTGYHRIWRVCVEILILLSPKLGHYVRTNFENQLRWLNQLIILPRTNKIKIKNKNKQTPCALFCLWSVGSLSLWHVHQVPRFYSVLSEICFLIMS